MAIPADSLTDPEKELAAQYRQRGNDAARRAIVLARWRLGLVLGRASAFGIVVVIFACAATTGISHHLWFFATLGLVLAWGGCTVAITVVRARLRYAECLQDINEEAIARMQRNWNRIPLTTPSVPEASQGLADDLDVFGHGSLYHLLCQAHTPWGIATLRDWLLQPATDDRRDCQQAVAEMAGDLELRQELATRGRLLTVGPAGPHEFATWAESKTHPFLRRLMAWRWIYPIVLAVLTVLFAMDQISPTVFGSSILAMLFWNFILSVFVCGHLHDILQRIGARGEELYQYKGLFALMGRAISAFPSLARLLDNLSLREATAALKRLHHILYFTWPLDLPIVWVPVQTVTLWDFHLYSSLDKWRRRHGANVRTWLETLGQLEAFNSLASLAYNNPNWCYPTIRTDATEKITASDLAHPLLCNAVRVPNDVTLGPRGSVLFVTGSNMTGKSTLLRAVGLNVILAQAGAPVCATHFEMPRVTLATTVRVRDSLEYGVSLYMSELLRLKQVLDQAQTMESQPDTTVLFLLDEILLGTNTTERHIAAREVISELVRLRSFGAVSTHDLELPKDPQLDSFCQNVHFGEQLIHENGTVRLEFDYRLRPGITQSTNAIHLLNAVGLRRPTPLPSSQAARNTG